MTTPIANQVVVITGASSGLGRETTLRFGERGATVVLAAREREALEAVAEEIERSGGRAHVVPTDVSVWTDVEALATAAIERFGRIDTWINNAAVSVYAPVADLTIDEIERVIRVDLLGQIYGMKAALPHLRRQNQGTIINVASVLADRAAPLQAPYCASKHGIKGFTEALRMELAHEGSAIDVVLVLPPSMNTPFFAHARSKLGVEPQPIPPVYDPRVAAEAIVAVAERPQRDLYIGGASKMLSVMERISPSLLDRFMLLGGSADRGQRTSKPDEGQDDLNAPTAGPQPTDGESGALGEVASGALPARKTSFYTRLLGLHPNRERALVGASLLGGIALTRRAAR